MSLISDAHTAVTPLKGRRAVITGGTTGIGRAIAILLASEGAKVFVCGRDKTHLKDALAAIRAVGEGDGIALDLGKPDAVTMPAERRWADSTWPSPTPRSARRG